ncbi:MAG: lipoyl(octanoyl) transferase LipB [Bacteroidota bacterium]
MIEIEDWGVIDFKTAWERQRELVQQVLKGEKPSTLVLCEHPRVITIGRAGSLQNVLKTPEELLKENIEIVEINRGGDVTLHAPGQLVGYPIFHLSDFKEDLHWFLREIEECIIELLKEFSVESGRVEGLTGVWIENERKICAIGLNCSRWVTSHGFALNVNNDIRDFEMIIPCGIEDKAVTSLKKEIGEEVDFKEVKAKCGEVFKRKF